MGAAFISIIAERLAGPSLAIERHVGPARL